MRREGREDSTGMLMFAVARRIGPRPARRLFIRFCHEVSRLSERMEIEHAPFEVSFREPGTGFCVAVTPLRDLFVVSLGEDRSFDVRVSSNESFMTALDLVLERHLSAASKTAGAA